MGRTIALYGGSFNPPTIAHRAIGEMLRNRLPVDEVWLMVSLQNPLKPTAGMAPFAFRLAMTELCVQGLDRVYAQDYEARYQVCDTASLVQALRRDHPEDHFIVCIGADNFVSLHRWMNHEWLLRHASIAVIPRGDDTARIPACPVVEKNLIRPLENEAALKTSQGFFVLARKEAVGPPKQQDVSATSARAALREGRRPTILSNAVYSYIKQHNLYAGPA